MEKDRTFIHCKLPMEACIVNAYWIVFMRMNVCDIVARRVIPMGIAAHR